ncbi:sulfatase [Phycisphaeraceae bacterium D3-23]
MPAQTHGADAQSADVLESTTTPPNIVIILADDLYWGDLGCMGNAQVRTPNIDRLAEEGLCFDAAFTSTAMCSPTRQQMLTGLWPVRSGAWPNHSRVYDGVHSLPTHLGALGYRTAQIGKRHYNPASSYPFEHLGRLPHQEGLPERLPRLAERVSAFIEDAGDQPWCLYYASNQPHRPFSVGDPTHFPPDSLEVPAHLIDSPDTRSQLSLYYAEVEMLDAEVGMLMDVLDTLALAEKTLVIFTSEQGAAHVPFGGKWTCWDQGLRTAMVARLPGRIPAGQRTDAIVQYVDITPTLIEIAGGDPRATECGVGGAPDGGNGFDGRSFADILYGERNTHRDLAYGIQTTRGIINGSESYPIRSVRDERWLMVWNLNAGNEPFQNIFHSRDTVVWDDWLVAAEDDPALAARIDIYKNRPEFELYDTQADPALLKNLADTPDHAQRLRDMHTQLQAWMHSQGDEGLATEAQAAERQRR